MRHNLTVFALLTIPTLCLAQSFQKDGGAFVWRNGKEFVRFDNGQWTGGIEGGKTLSWHVFLWHDEWVYETPGGGKVEAGPTLQPDGTITMSGVFSAREGSPPMKYALRITASAEGVKVHCEFDKSAVLKLANGIWLHIYADKSFTGKEDVWARPSAHFAANAASDVTANRVFFDVDGRRSLCLDTGNMRDFGPDTYAKDGLVYRYNLVPKDFPFGQKSVVEYTIAFDDMPEKFGGEIYPMAGPLSVRWPFAAPPPPPAGARPGDLPALEAPVEGRPGGPLDVAVYQTLDTYFILSATYDNPFDPDDVAVDAEFTTPSGKRLTVPCFFRVGYHRQVADQAEAMVPQGNGEWRLRFTPTEIGKYTVRLRAKDRTGVAVSNTETFHVKSDKDAGARDNPGFIRVSKADPHYFAFDNGKGYFAIGHNLPGYHTSDQLGDEAMRKMAANKENYNRWWMSSSSLGIEWGGKLGWYRQDAAARIDLVLDTARDLQSKGTPMYYMMCMDTHQDFREGGWERNPFNAKNGGPCKTAGEWFTSDTARKLYKKRLRYTIARWGYSPNVLCWEFGNEFEGWADTDDAARLAWHREMSDYLRATDPYGHLITTSFWSNTGPAAYWNLPSIDIVQTHCYTNDDNNVAERVHEYGLHQWNAFAKPHLFGEFGIRSGAGTETLDPKGWGLHNALWAGATSFCAGGPMPWWHENYIDPLNLYFHFTSIANFTADLPLGTAKWEPVQVAPPVFADKNHVPETRDAKVIPRSIWGKPEFNEFALQPDGTFVGDRLPQQLLQGQGHKDLQNPPTFVVNYPQAGKFTMHIDTVSNSGLVRVVVDGAKVAEYDLPCGEGLGVKSVYRPEWTLWETVYDKNFAVDIPAGQHRIQVTNEGKDWVRVTSYTFTGCKVLDKPNLLVCGMRTKGLAVLWIQNRDSDWFNQQAGKVAKVAPSRIEVQGLADGPCTVEWWETWKGAKVKETRASVKGGKLALDVPELGTDVGVKVRQR